MTILHASSHCPPPIQKDDGAKGADANHQALVLTPKACAQFVKDREKQTVKLRPMSQSNINAFCLEHKWETVKSSVSARRKTAEIFRYIWQLLDKYFPEKKTITMTNLDKHWMTPELKQLLRQAQRTRLKEGRSSKFKRLFRKVKRAKLDGVGPVDNRPSTN